MSFRNKIPTCILSRPREDLRGLSLGQATLEKLRGDEPLFDMDLGDADATKADAAGRERERVLKRRKARREPIPQASTGLLETRFALGFVHSAPRRAR